jgi:hypothetical protein
MTPVTVVSGTNILEENTVFIFSQRVNSEHTETSFLCNVSAHQLWRFGVDWGAWTAWSWHQGVIGQWRERAATAGQGNKGAGCLLAVRRFWRRRRGLCVIRRQCLICSGHLQGLVCRHLYCWTLEMMTLWPACSSRESVSSQIVISLSDFILIVILPNYKYMFFLGQNIVWNHSPDFNIAFIGKIYLD